MGPQRRSTIVTVGITQAPTQRHPELKTLKGKVYNCDVEWTWEKVFKTFDNFQLDPNRYIITSCGKQAVRVDDKVRSLIGQFQKVLKKYSINIKEGRLPAAAPPTNKVSNAHNRSNDPKIAAASVPSQRQNNRNSASPSTSAASSTTTATMPVPHGARSKKPTNLTNGHHPTMSRPIYPEDDCNLFPPRDRNDFGRLLQDDDDNASQVTTDSQESQDDLIELGLANEDYKPKVVQRFMKNISNPQSIRIREELRRIMNDGKWNRVSQKIPHTANFLMEIFRFQPHN